MQLGCQTFYSFQGFLRLHTFHMETSNESNVVGINDVQFRGSLDPQLGDYHHSGGICLTGVWMEEMEEERGVGGGITTLSLTLK